MFIFPHPSLVIFACFVTVIVRPITAALEADGGVTEKISMAPAQTGNGKTGQRATPNLQW